MTNELKIINLLSVKIAKNSWQFQKNNKIWSHVCVCKESYSLGCCWEWHTLPGLTWGVGINKLVRIFVPQLHRDVLHQSLFNVPQFIGSRWHQTFPGVFWYSKKIQLNVKNFTQTRLQGTMKYNGSVLYKMYFFSYYPVINQGGLFCDGYAARCR